MTFATGIGSMPGADQRAYGEALRVVLDELGEQPHLAYLPEVPGRGVTAGMLGRTLGLVTGVGIDLQPAGWRLTDAAGIDHRRARSLLAQDLDGLEEHAQEYVGSFKVQVAGPWTLAAAVEKPRGDKVLSDVGARRDLAQALAEGVRDHVRDVRRRLPGVGRLVVQVDEPGLSSVVAGKVPTASGFGRHRTIHPPEASEVLAWVLSAISDEGAEPWVHSCAPGTPLGLLRGAGARGLCVDSAQLSAADHSDLGEALEAGESVVLGVDVGLEDRGDEGAVIDRVVRWLELLGLDADVVGSALGVSSSCGLSGVSRSVARESLRRARAAASELGTP